MASRLLIWGVGEACGVLEGDVRTQTEPHMKVNPEPSKTNENPTQGGDVEASDRLESEWLACGDPLERLLGQQIRCVEFCGSEVVVDAPRSHHVILPGSFNPLHKGHRSLLEVAEQITGLPGCFELAVQNPDKGTLSRSEVEGRLEQFVALGLPVVVTLKPIFTAKADLFKDCTFVVGHDTAVRLVMPKYYGGSEAKMMAEFARVRHQGCSFLVAGRVLANGSFKELSDAEVPGELEDLFQAIPEAQFRVDISSTELREKQGLQ
eukprot:evm.model.scf_4242.1 EVM.evm.TU.scf_4242.1   scf_4242:2002-2793(+)